MVKQLFIYLSNIFYKFCLYIKILYFYHEIHKIKPQETYNRTISILLAAGTSSRFGKHQFKQLFTYKNKELIVYSIESMLEQLNTIIIVTNSNCLKQITEIIKSNKLLQIKQDQIHITTNDINCRLESIGRGIQYIKENRDILKIKDFNGINLLIHDSARPYIPYDYYNNMIINTKFYSQYCLKLTNGLMDLKYNTLVRDEYIELCSPICINFKLSEILYFNFMKKSNRQAHEFIDIIKMYNLPIQIYYGKYKYLRKITYQDDLD
jgi:2-C-methyl-D-erythritol 4-phosphate cytidylyltransferase